MLFFKIKYSFLNISFVISCVQFYQVFNWYITWTVAHIIHISRFFHILINNANNYVSFLHNQFWSVKYMAIIYTLHAYFKTTSFDKHFLSFFRYINRTWFIRSGICVLKFIEVFIDKIDEESVYIASKTNTRVPENWA